MADKTIATVEPQTSDGEFDLALRGTKSLANLNDRLVAGASALLHGAAGASGTGQILAANASRKKFWFQNAGINVLTVTLGATSVQLKGCDVAGDGSGGFMWDPDWKGAVSVSGTSPSYNYGEI
jgi:hypothetical protein